jgi:hypothetical protein
MRTSRRGEDPTKKKGVEPTKAQSEVKVTAKRTGEPPRKRYYTEEDYKRNEEIKARNAAKKAQYESDMASYNKAMKLYNEGDVPTASAEELSVMNKANANVKGKKATFSENKNVLSAAKENERYDQLIKSGKYVDIDDPRIDAKTKYFLKGATMGVGGGTDILGEKTGKVAVPIEKALGKEKPTKWGDVYGGKDFNPYEFDKASRSGNLEGYMKKTGMRPGDLAVSEVGAMTQYKKREKPTESAYEKEEDIKETDFLRKMPIKKAKLDMPKGELAGVPKKKTGEWTEPGDVKHRTKYKMQRASTMKGGKVLTRFIGSNVEYAFKKLKGENALRPGLIKTEGKERIFQGKEGREAKLAKAYFGAGYENQPLSTLEETRADLKGKKKELRADVKSARKEGIGDLELRKAKLKDVKAELKQNRLGAKYLKRYDQELTGVSKGTGVNEYGGKIKDYTGQKMAGFEESRQNTYDPEANVKALKAKRQNEFESFRSQLANKANQNTISNQEKSLSFMDKVRASKQNNIQKREDRKNAPSFAEKRQQKKLDRAAMKSAEEKASRIGQ